MYMYKIYIYIYIYCTYTYIIKMSKTNTGLTVLPQKHCPRDCMEFPPEATQEVAPCNFTGPCSVRKPQLGMGCSE